MLHTSMHSIHDISPCKTRNIKTGCTLHGLVEILAHRNAHKMIFNTRSFYEKQDTLA